MESVSVAVTEAAEQGLTDVSGPPGFVQAMFCRLADSLDALHFLCATLWIDLEALDGAMPWTWCVARKSVEGREAIQFERLVGELTWWNTTQYLQVTRAGVQSRFLPIKEFDDLERHHDALEAMVGWQRGR